MRILTIALFLAAQPVFGGIPAQAGETAEQAVEWCGKSTNMPDEICACIGRRAESDLNAKQQRFFIAMVSKNKAEQDALRGDMTVNEMTEVAMFATTSPQKCAAE
ncbi:MAG: hypothetical protein KDJ16_02800 [Hyphomicrobiales bacterium]|nr:hypothetical protein [Hyphomicrobiales bacterium]